MENKKLIIKLIGLVLLFNWTCTQAYQKNESPEDHITLVQQTKPMEPKVYISSTKGLPEAYQTQVPIYIFYSKTVKTRKEESMRIYEDGSMFRWSDSKRIEEDGEKRRVKAGYQWRLDNKIKLEAIEQLKQLLQGGFQELAPIPATGRDKDRPKQFRYANLEGAYKEFSMPSMPNKDWPAILQAIDNTIYHNIIPEAVPYEQQ